MHSFIENTGQARDSERMISAIMLRSNLHMACYYNNFTHSEINNKCNLYVVPITWPASVPHGSARCHEAGEPRGATRWSRGRRRG